MKATKDKELEEIFKEVEADFIPRPDKAILIQHAHALKREIDGDNNGDPVDDDRRLKNMPKCHNCGSIQFLQTGTCKTCSVCGEPQGGCG